MLIGSPLVNEWAETLFSTLYLILVVGLVAFAFHKVKMLVFYLRRRTVEPPSPASTGLAPKVCVQCPVYNEPLVVEGLLDAVANLQWPADRLEIQVLDDSTDETSARVAAWLDRHPEAGGRMRHVRRSDRAGYKAGALAHGMALTDAEFLAIFDADFRPPTDFLVALMPHFAAPDVGLVQARWEFANRRASLLTRFQAIFLDAHLVIEQAARHFAGLFFNFNGTAGIWRRTALDQAGGWSADTVTEDLDVSYRAQLCGWRFVFRGDYTVPSELPENITAFKSQQRRWTKGGIQVMRKQLATLLYSRLPARIKREAAWHLLVGFIHPLLFAFAVLLVPYALCFAPEEGILSWLRPPALVFVLWVTIGLYVAAQRVRARSWGEAIIIVVGAPFILSFGLAMSVANTVAFFEGLLQGGGEFMRTPKGGSRARPDSLFTHLHSRSQFLAIAAGEFALGSGLLLGAWHSAQTGRFGLALVLAGKSLGFLTVAALSVRDLSPAARLVWTAAWIPTDLGGRPSVRPRLPPG